MKKKGSALVIVLVILTALLVTGTAVYSYIVSTSKTNNMEMQKEAVKTASMSALNIGEYYLINDKNYKNIMDSSSVTVPKEYVKEIVNSTNFNNNVKNGYELDDYNYDIVIKNKGNGNYDIVATAYKGKNKSENKSTVKIDSIKNKGEDFFKALGNNEIGMFNILNNSDFSISNSVKDLSGISYNFYNFKGEVPEVLEDGYNLNLDNKKIASLNLNLKKEDIALNNLDDLINDLEYFSNGYKVILFDNNNNYKYLNSYDIDSNILNNYSGALVKLNDDWLNASWNDSYLLIYNGNLNIEDNIFDLEGDELFIYGNGKVNLNRVYLGDEASSIIRNNRTYISIVSSDGINIKNSVMHINGSFKDKNNNLSSILKKFVK
ncbi:hypothetical protein ACFO6R_02980 [Eubacterium multiforme]|uniref:PilX N-terminal n=1 Tax=Eubacterium multiforme TaxID=83339 RepID=A0ABT9URJ0_9FIRM|nr:hypothetical protein [Eubacterium multiforme]MDQ0148279.1 hypothetical protein [Eubacterium multiforme]